MTLNWLRRLLSIPQEPCRGCEAYQQQMTHMIYENEKLLRYILEPKEMQAAAPIKEEEPEPIVPKIVPWKIRKEMLEREDRQKAALMKQAKEEQQQAIEELENRLKVNPLVVPSGETDSLGETDVQSSTVEADGGTHQQEKVEGKR